MFAGVSLVGISFHRTHARTHALRIGRVPSREHNNTPYDDDPERCIDRCTYGVSTNAYVVRGSGANERPPMKEGRSGVLHTTTLRGSFSR